MYRTGWKRELPVFSEKHEDPAAAYEAAVETDAWPELKNYTSFINNATEAAEEMARLVDKGFVKRLPWTR